MGQVIAFGRPAAAAVEVVTDTTPAAVMITIPVAAEVMAHIDHAALWAGIDRTELLRRFVAAGYSR